MPHPYRSQILDPLGLVAGMLDAVSRGEIIDRAPDPIETRGSWPRTMP
jgi:hypothetical protein